MFEQRFKHAELIIDATLLKITYACLSACPIKLCYILCRASAIPLTPPTTYLYKLEVGRYLAHENCIIGMDTPYPYVIPNKTLDSVIL